MALLVGVGWTAVWTVVVVLGSGDACRGALWLGMKGESWGNGLRALFGALSSRGTSVSGGGGGDRGVATGGGFLLRVFFSAAARDAVVASRRLRAGAVVLSGRDVAVLFVLRISVVFAVGPVTTLNGVARPGKTRSDPSASRLRSLRYAAVRLWSCADNTSKLGTGSALNFLHASNNCSDSGR